MEHILATRKQIQYLQALADKAEFIKMRHPSVMPLGLYHIKWDEVGITSEKASLCIKFYQSILDNAELIIHPDKVVEDLPEC